MIGDILNSWQYLVVLNAFIVLSVVEFRMSSLRQKQRVRYLCLTVFILFFGFRGYIGWDVNSYYPIFLTCPTIGDLSFHNLLNLNSEIREPGFLIYMSFLKSLWNNYHFYILVSTCIDAIVLNYFFKRYSFNYALCFVIFMAMLIGFEIDLQRNAKSLMLFLLSIHYINERRFLPFLLLNIVGMTFHLTSILFIPLYFFLHRTLSFRMAISLFVMAQISYFLQIDYLKPLLLQVGSVLNNSVGDLLVVYSVSEQFSWSKGISIGHLERTLTFMMILIYYYRLQFMKRENIVFVNSFILFACIQIFFVGLSTLCNRLSLLFIFSYIVIWPELFRCFRLRSNKRIALSFIFLYAFLKVADMNSGIFYKYDNVLFGIDPFEERNITFNRNAANLTGQ